IHEIFDFPDPSQIKGEREVTTVASQALYFMNSDFVAELASDTAKSLLEIDCDEAKRIEHAYLRVLARKPNAAEIADAKAYLAESDLKQADLWETFIQALFASAEFRYVL